MYMAQFPLLYFPLANPFFTYLEASSCDRNRPPQSQVARKLTPFVPHWPLVPSLPKSQLPLGFPGLNVYLIKATLQTQPLGSRTSITGIIIKCSHNRKFKIFLFISENKK
jgi:hypothetical protein